MRHGQTTHERFGGEPGDMRREHRVRQTEQRIAAWQWFLAEHVEPRAAQMARGQSLDQPRLIDEFAARSEEHTSELQSLMRISYAVFCLKKKKPQTNKQHKCKQHAENSYYKYSEI